MKFEKVSFEQWASDISLMGVPRMQLRMWYDQIRLPKQGSSKSMGVDFSLPYGVKILPHNTIVIPTGIRWVCEEDEQNKYGLLIVPRSSIGIKFGLRLANTVGVIDSDYFEAENEGHIMLIFENTTGNEVSLEKGKAVAQGIITTYCIPENAESEEQRTGGIGSTDNTEGHI